MAGKEQRDCAWQRAAAMCNLWRLPAYGITVGALVMLALLLSGCGPAIKGTADAASPPPTSAVADYTAAQTLASDGHCDRAIPLYLRALVKNDMYVSAYIRLAYCYQVLGSYNAGITEYDKAIAADPTNFGLYLGRAGVEALNGSTGAASDDNYVALRLCPAQVPSFSSIADSFASYGDYTGAIKALTDAIALVPNNAALYDKRAHIYVQAQDFGRAYADFNRAVAVAPAIALRAMYYADMAEAYDQEQDFDSAAHAIAAATKLQPASAHLYVLAGNIQQDAGAYTAALAAYNMALRLSPQGPDAAAAHEGRGDVFGRLIQPRKAIAEYRLAARLTTDPAAQARLASKIKAIVAPQ